MGFERIGVGRVRYGSRSWPAVSDGFLHLTDMKLPESSTAFVDRSMSTKECEKMCHENCSCTAYASADIRGGGTGCVIWSGDLVDMRQYAAAEGGQDLFVRVPAAYSGMCFFIELLLLSGRLILV